MCEKLGIDYEVECQRLNNLLDEAKHRIGELEKQINVVNIKNQELTKDNERLEKELSKAERAKGREDAYKDVITRIFNGARDVEIRVGSFK